MLMPRPLQRAKKPPTRRKWRRVVHRLAVIGLRFMTMISTSISAWGMSGSSSAYAGSFCSTIAVVEGDSIMAREATTSPSV
jgi:hypothetical protein